MVTWHHRPPVLGGYIHGDRSVSSINHLWWMSTCKHWPPATYLYICVKIIQTGLIGWPVVAILQIWPCRFMMLLTWWLAENFCHSTVACIERANQHHHYNGMLAGRQEHLFVGCMSLYIGGFTLWNRHMNQQFCIASIAIESFNTDLCKLITPWCLTFSSCREQDSTFNYIALPLWHRLCNKLKK